MSNSVKLRNVFISLGLYMLCSLSAAIAFNDTDSPPKKLLFVGNSFSFYNNGIHNHLGSLIRANGDWQNGQNRHKLLSYSGGHIHEQLGSMLSIIENDTRGFDAVVLQAHSNEAIHPKKRARFATSLKQAVEIVKVNNLRPYLFMTWGYKGDADMAKQVADAYILQAKRLNIDVVPVGLAFTAANSKFPDIDLYVPDVLAVTDKGTLSYRDDIKHPSEAGTYLAACVFYAAFFDKSPEGNAFVASLSKQDALKLQRLSWEVVKMFTSADSKSQPDIIRGN